MQRRSGDGTDGYMFIVQLLCLLVALVYCRSKDYKIRLSDFRMLPNCYQMELRGTVISLHHIHWHRCDFYILALVGRISLKEPCWLDFTALIDPDGKSNLCQTFKFSKSEASFNPIETAKAWWLGWARWRAHREARRRGDRIMLLAPHARCSCRTQLLRKIQSTHNIAFEQFRTV